MTTLFAMSNGLFAAWLIVGTICTLWYVIVPLLLAMVSRVAVEPTAELIDGANYPIPEAAQERLDQQRNQLLSLGFEPLQAYVVHGFGAHVESLHYAFVNRSTSRFARILVTLIVSARDRRLHIFETRICGDYRGGRYDLLMVYNTSQNGPFFKINNELHYFFPHVNNIHRLIELLNSMEHRENFDATRFLKLDSEFGGNGVAWGLAESKRFLVTLCQQRFLKLRPSEREYRYPLRSVYRVYLRMWWPLNHFFRVILTMRAMRLEAALLKNSSSPVVK
jgi:hypothetical protein